MTPPARRLVGGLAPYNDPMPAMQPNRRWIWFFVVLIVLSVAAVTSLIVYNLRQQLKPEQIAVARRLWREKKPDSYQLAYTIKKGTDARAESFVVRVRDRKAVSVTLDGRPLEKRLFEHYVMDALLDFINDSLESDAKPGRPRTFTRGIFDPASGALRWYVRRVMGGSERVEITVNSLVTLQAES